ncbi:hypothetical protein N0V93_003402 [Gnomoniopsis smithogilvyi]|uniref:Rhodopsin domain-containing protein n=1 Tax=Gnomoniopsis smithogilvyi TaxID=1191159 RepID=A0A9W8YWK8_9PEZI|nr:hypothetical protein N0V93_003402 [Gnomoniopsis smithogilvyi]
MHTTVLTSLATATGNRVVARDLEAMGRGTELLIVLIVVLVLAWVFVLLRAYVRYYMIRNIAADDWWMFASLIAYTGYSVEAIYGVVYGGAGLKTWYISEILYAPVSAMVRTSVALFLLRVSAVPCHKWIILVNLSAIYVISIVFTFVVTFQCDPPSYFYDQVLGLAGRCMPIEVVPYVTIAHSSVSAVADLVFAWLPIAMLWNVQLNKRTKVVVALLLGMGSVAGLALLVRIPFVRILAVSPDFLFETIDVAIWSVLEPSLGIMAGCMATMRPLFKGFGIGRNPSRVYVDKYVPVSSKLARSNGEQRSFRIIKVGECISLPAMDIERPTQGLIRDDAAYKHNSADNLTLRMSPISMEFLKPSVKTNIMSSRNSAVLPQAEDSGAISVHTTIHTESIYEDVQPAQEGGSWEMQERPKSGQKRN